ncbi:imm11 family protein [Corallococcus exiguus]|uniref:Immunity MXAN-0049 protein domain-containing protein n=1 Tax=Corallococcus exiguus TaxID=83462 RepID=A0A7X5BSG8_9BACT|nr:DUF1629 domain-containing protein [Corallococcus exiguus]NBC44296.1 hypothetical protein [Corallococcus exiguus]TNV60513.1 hypothetical protein FH620_24140 [Corallococcus exiguus]
MTSRFFELSDDASWPGRWLLDDPMDAGLQELEDARIFNRGHRVRIEGRLRIPVEHPGQALDFTQTSSMVPVVGRRVAAIFADLAPNDVQLILANVEGEKDPFRILVATRLIRCIDEPRSRVQFWTAEDGLPEKVGKYYAVDDLHIDPTQVGEAKVFRLEGWAGTLIVSEDIKLALERIRATGMRFTEV